MKTLGYLLLAWGLFVSLAGRVHIPTSVILHALNFRLADIVSVIAVSLR